MGLLDRLRSAMRPKRGITHAQLAMVALRSAHQVDAHAFFTRARATWNDLPALTEIHGDDRTVSAHMGRDGLILVGLLPFPIPAEDLDAACESSAWWPEARKELSQHVAHAVVHVAGDVDAIHASLILTRFVATYAIEANALGVYWGNAGAVHEPAAFFEQARVATRDALPVLLWIGFGRTLSKSGATYLRTVGMAQYSLPNIEVAMDDAQGTDELELVGDIATHLLLNGMVIKDGDTIGRTAFDRRRAYLRESAVAPGERILALAPTP